ncbi:MAG: hypothetical protein JST50_11280 [Bacteroidetes bacterium]|nr:hypothetical protein [Bacteroidota bacterium]
MPLVSQPQHHASHGIAANEVGIDTRVEPIVYKIRVKKPQAGLKEFNLS